MKVLKWAHKNKRLTELPTVEPIPTDPKHFEPPTEEQLVRLIQALPPHLKTAVWFMAETGCRSGEAFNLTWDDVDLIAGDIHIRSKTGWTPKTKASARRVFITGALLDALRNAPRSGTYVFPSRNSLGPINNIRKAFATAAKKAGLATGRASAAFTPHGLRKAYATRLALSGVPQRLLQANLGHSAGSRVTDQYYVFASDAARRGTVASLPMPLIELGVGNIGQQR